MAKRYYVRENQSWHTWQFLKTRKNDPKWKNAYLIARAKRERRRFLVLTALISALFLTGVASFYVAQKQQPTSNESEFAPLATAKRSKIVEKSSSQSSVSQSSATSATEGTNYNEPVVYPVTNAAPIQADTITETPPASEAPAVEQTSESSSDPETVTTSTEDAKLAPGEIEYAEFNYQRIRVNPTTASSEVKAESSTKSSNEADLPTETQSVAKPSQTQSSTQASNKVQPTELSIKESQPTMDSVVLDETEE